MSPASFAVRLWIKDFYTHALTGLGCWGLKHGRFNRVRPFSVRKIVKPCREGESFAHEWHSDKLLMAN